jgi:hypothetical protein
MEAGSNLNMIKQMQSIQIVSYSNSSISNSNSNNINQRNNLKLNQTAFSAAVRKTVQ